MIFIVVVVVFGVPIILWVIRLNEKRRLVGLSVPFFSIISKAAGAILLIFGT